MREKRPSFASSTSASLFGGLRSDSGRQSRKREYASQLMQPPGIAPFLETPGTQEDLALMPDLY